MARRLFFGIFLLLVLAAPASGDVGSRKNHVDQQITRLHEKIASAHAQVGSEQFQ